jgi:hypothetical protein
MTLLLRVAVSMLALFPAAAATVDYGRDILPILSDKCYHCHGPDEKARKAKLRLDVKESALRTNKPIILPGRSHESELVSRITTTNLDDKMPPPESNRTLTPRQIELLTRWIDEGANWGIHWAFVPPKKPIVPNIGSSAISETARSQDESKPNTDYLVRNPIDAFVAARLQKERLRQSPEATKETWLRRVTFDLTGLPPTLKDFDDFLADSSANAHEKVVDRLLASPRFGERMATDWLDLARFADTHGYQMDRFRPVWPYRDWVIKAFNQNLSFDRFVTWQLAGDLLPKATKEQRLATAFNRLHNQNEEGGVVEEEYRVAYVVDRVNTFGTAFLGLTTECSRCHDHKYDPLTQRDFYSLFAFFQNIDESGQTSYFTDSMPVPTVLLSTDEQDKRLAQLNFEIGARENDLVKLRAGARDEFAQWLSSIQSSTNRQQLLASAGTNGLLGYFSFDEMISNRIANLAGANSAQAHEGPQLVPGKLGHAVKLNGENGFTFGKTGHFTRADEFTLAMWLQTPSHAPRFVVAHHSKAPIDAGSRGYELLLEDGRVAFGLHHMWPGNSLKVTTRTKLPTNEWVHVAVTYDGSSRARGVRIFINGEVAELETVRDGLWKDITYGGDEPELTIGYRFRDNGFKDGRVDEFRIFNRALTPIEVANISGRSDLTNALTLGGQTLTAAERDGLFEFFFANAFAPAQRTRNELHKYRDEQRKFINPIAEIMAMQELPEPKPAYILKRGAYDAHGERVSANTPAVLPPFPAGQPTNRLGLAKWLLEPDHPLMARVTVNRFWQMMFGKGIVETSDNFGSQGAQPTHPELLDWLARDFVDSGWDVKRLLKTIALSSTYRQSSQTSPEMLARDPQNELLARGPARRLTAEMLRDQSLALSKLLVEKIGGPSVKPYQPDGIWDIAMGKPKYDVGKGDDLHRRSLYTYWKRTVPPPVMVTFDAADRSYCTVRRQQTSTPLQALALLNDTQFIEAARYLGQRMLKEGGAENEERVTWMFRAVSGRRPTAKELPVLIRLLEEQHDFFKTEAGAADKLLAVGEAKKDLALDRVELAAATVLAEALLNHDSALMLR